MRDIIADVQRWNNEGKRIALATVIKTWGSAPRKAGAHMAINSEGEFSGSVSGGCVEGAVIEEALAIIQKQNAKLLHFGVSDDTAWDVGLACGGELDIFVQALKPEIIPQITDFIRNDVPFRYSFMIDGPDSILNDPNIQIDLELNDTGYPKFEIDGKSKEKSTKFSNTILPAPKLIIVGGVHITIKLAQIAKALNYKVVVIDPRRAFGSKNRFPELDDLMVEWPTEALKSINLNNSTAVVTLTHDPKIDDPALLTALDSQAFYIGALGSKKTHRERQNRLKEFGLSDEQLNKIKSPVGLDIGSQSPEEIALAIMAEIVAVKYGLR